MHESAESAAGPASQLAVTTESHALPDCAQCAGIVWVTPRGRVDSQWQTLLGGFRPLNPAPWEGSALLRGFWNLVFHFRGYAKKKALPVPYAFYAFYAWCIYLPVWPRRIIAFANLLVSAALVLLRRSGSLLGMGGASHLKDGLGKKTVTRFFLERTAATNAPRRRCQGKREFSLPRLKLSQTLKIL